MLDNNNHNNSTCAFAEQIVSYLYGETTAEEKCLFESHLKSCQICPAEFAGFSAARSSVIEWRDLEFSSLETPLIEIPYDETRKVFNSPTVLPTSRSWLAEFRKLFSLSPALSASAAFALIVLCVGIVFFVTKSSSSVEIAGSDNKNSEQTLVASSINKEVSPDDKLQKTPVDDRNYNRAATSEPKTTRKDSIVKVAEIQRTSTKSLNQEAKTPKVKSASAENKTPTFAQTRKIPRLNNYEEVEDKSLRLAELLEDEGAK